MPNTTESLPFTFYVAAMAVLVLKLMTLGAFTAIVRGRGTKFLNPEDMQKDEAELSDVEAKNVARLKRAHLNALENELPFLAVAFIYLLTNPSATAAAAFFGLFVLCRILHSVFYARAVQPFRTISFAGASITLFALVCATVYNTVTMA